MEAKLIPVKDVAPNPDITRVLGPYHEKVKVKMAELIGEATEDLTYSRSGESPLANMVADAFREKAKTQIAIHNVGGIRARVTKGVITWGKAFEVLPFQNTLITLKLTGAQLKKTLERGLVPTVGITAISGLRVQYDRSKPPGQQVTSAHLLDGAAVEDSGLYSIATNDFVLAGGDGYDEFAKGTDIIETGVILRDVFVEYIRARRVLSPSLDGRIVIN
jgi:2',3'-cyclic-nucleotide 2'-phosphodiesterase/3'-nucleotidase